MFQEINQEIDNQHPSTNIKHTYLEKLQPNLLYRITKLKLTPKAYQTTPATNIMKKLDTMTLSVEQEQQYRNCYERLFDSISDFRFYSQQISIKEQMKNIHLFFHHLDKNTPVISAPSNSDERQKFYQKLKKGYLVIGKLLFDEFEKKTIGEEEVFSCLEMIAEGSLHCAGRWRKVLEEIFTSFHDKFEGFNKLEPSEGLTQYPIDQTLSTVFFDARKVLINQYTNEFIEKNFSMEDESMRVHYETYFQKYFNEIYAFNLPLSEEPDAIFDEDDCHHLNDISIRFCENKNIRSDFLQKAIRIFLERVETQYTDYENVVNFVQKIYREEGHKQFEDCSEFLSTCIFSGFSRKITDRAMITMLEDRGFITETCLTEPELQAYFKKLIEDGKYEIFIQYLKEHQDEVPKASFLEPVILHPIHTPTGKTSLLSFCIARGYSDVAKTIACMGLSLEVEDESTNTSKTTDPTSAISGRKPLHVAVLAKDIEMFRCLIENGADPFKGQFKHENRILISPAELAIEMNNIDVMDLLIKDSIKKNKLPWLSTEHGKTSLLTHFIFHHKNESAEKLLTQGLAQFKEATLDSLKKQLYFDLLIAVKVSNEPMVNQLLKAGADPFEIYQRNNQAKHETSFQLAIKEDNQSIARVMINTFTTQNVNAIIQTDKGKTTLLNYLIEHHQTTFAVELFLQGADAKKWEDGQNLRWALHPTENVLQYTPFANAVHKKNHVLVELFVSKGCDPFSPVCTLGNGNNLSAVDMALQDKNFELFDKMLKGLFHSTSLHPSFVDKKLRFLNGQLPIITYLIGQGHNRWAKRAIIAGASVEALDCTQQFGWGEHHLCPVRGRRPLHMAIKMQNAEMVRFLLEHGADPCAIFYTSIATKQTPLQLANKEKNKTIIHEIEEHLLKEKIKQNCFAKSL